ncbi:DUF4233 domain-containing protein [Nocardioides mesophilus]|uniref:DUF4233 domain-containing protein n=2 Tax=Nocardioides mesophilus TaxID=433659 RepID=A0A7G9RGR8_9ACTN|nr:DUF4233 domain-containing protein [Nocardioides mesophilus]
MCAGMLSLQSVVLFLTGVATIGSTDLSAGTSIGIGLGLALLCVVAAGLLRRPGGYLLGWAVQVLSIGLGFLVPAMFFLGVVFGALWAGAYFLGERIDRENLERAAAEAEWSAQHGGGAAG